MCNPPDSTPDRSDWQDVRLAVVLNGGVSLAIWIGGATLELSRLVQASRGVYDRDGHYARLLAGLRATARIDVISGTSAGGVNGGFLALGLVHNCDLTPLGDLWAEKADFAALLRDPMASAPPSLLQGDDYFLAVARQAYGQVLGHPLPAALGNADPDPVDLFITTTLLEGQVSTFTDDQGTVISERDFAATFRFSNRGRTGCGDLRDRARIGDALAVASRATASFPGAFEPHWLPVGTAAASGEHWNSGAGLASFDRSQYVVDGGVLQNKPIRPALDAIYRQPADRQVRRILAYVVPDPGAVAESRPNPSTTDDGNGPPPGGPPNAGTVLLAVNTRLRGAESVARELDEIRQRNQATFTRRAARSRLAEALAAGSGALVDSLWNGYLSERRANAGRVVAGFIDQPAAGADRCWSRTEIAAELRDLPGLPFVPGTSTFEAAVELNAGEWSWGLTTVQRLGATCVDVFKRALWLAPLSQNEIRTRLMEGRAELHGQLSRTRSAHAEVERFWHRLDLPTPPSGPAAGPSARAEALRAALSAALGRDSPLWDQEARFQEAQNLAELLRTAGPDLHRVAVEPAPRLDPDGSEHGGLRAILTHLLGPADRPRDRAGILRALLELDVVQTAITGATDEPEQTVELVQVSAHANATAGPSVEQKLTGLQLHHFGAFYRKSWRVNDWLWGRLDTATRLAETLLLPERLQQLGHTTESALALVRELATTGDYPQDREYLLAQFDETRCAQELGTALDPAISGGLGGRDDRRPTSLPVCAAALARARHLTILREELPRLAMAIRTDADQTAPLSARNQAWLVRYQEARPTVPLAAADAFDLLRANDIGNQRIADDLGSDGLTELSAGAAAVAAGALASATQFRPVRLGLQALRGYALLLWAMVLLTRNRGRIGVALVQATVISAAALLALSLLVPGIPAAVSLLAVAVILASITLACLRSLSVPPGEPDETAPGRWRRWAVRRIGLRVAVPSVLLLAAVATLAVQWGQLQVQTNTAIKALVTLAVIALGAWLGQVSSTPPARPDTAAPATAVDPSATLDPSASVDPGLTLDPERAADPPSDRSTPVPLSFLPRQRRGSESEGAGPGPRSSDVHK